ncbi:hypothetical protein [Tumebacillus flagellatus]|uniref:Uncharacterized protein n=1 Tax=Tumebacillus flagellatus TaxID=1157490 RepID=A0A074LRH3_9BACL|nr:hypothetical protein [Tumebacillus flagellatus]KEO84731.1 hypothetical protein EL26_04230 [Tumebacillus flagellatus]
MKRGMIIWGVLTLIVWIVAIVGGIANDAFNLRFLAYTLPMAAVLTVFVAILIELVLVLLGNRKRPASR